MKTKLIIVLCIAFALLTVPATANYNNGYAVDWNETDEAAFNAMIQPCLNVWNKAPFALLPVNNEVMRFAEFQELIRANHPDPVIRGEEIRMTPGGRSTVTYANQDNVVVVKPKPATLTKSVWILGVYHEDTAPESWRDVQYTKWRGELITFEVSSDEQ